jgi:hypothetical protein
MPTTRDFFCGSKKTRKQLYVIYTMCCKIFGKGWEVIKAGMTTVFAIVASVYPILALFASIIWIVASMMSQSTQHSWLDIVDLKKSFTVVLQGHKSLSRLSSKLKPPFWPLALSHSGLACESHFHGNSQSGGNHDSALLKCGSKLKKFEVGKLRFSTKIGILQDINGNDFVKLSLASL